ncbi:MAG TPA: carboxypeptidase-like regulatory domain-containing protein [Gemmatirosa sp.]
MPAAIVSPAGVPAAVHGVVYGVVYDSLTREPLAGATVQNVRAGDLTGSRSVAADSMGAFRIDSLAPGRYLVGFSHPLLDLLHVEAAPRLVEVGSGGDVVRVDLGVPALARVRPVLCGSPQAPTDSSGLLAGRVRDAADDAPVAHATVVLTWSELTFGRGGPRVERRRVPVTTGPEGRYVACGVPAGVELVASAAAPGRASGEVALDVPTLGFVVRDFLLGDSASAVVAAPAGAPLARGTARLTGTVRDTAGRPVPRARVRVWGTAAEAVTGADAAFSLAGLPAGTRTLEVRAIGFAPQRVAVDLAPGRAGTVDVRMGRPVPTLGPVTVFGKRVAASPLVQGFLDRRAHSAIGQFLTAEDFVRLEPVDVVSALRGLGGLKVVPNSRMGSTVLGFTPGGRPCQAAVFLNGLALDADDEIDLHVSPRDVAGVEVYRTPDFAPSQIPGVQKINCSVVMIWTR